MAFNINNFKAQGMTWGGARPSLFQVELFQPFGGLILNPEALRKFVFTCRAAELPESTISNIEIPYFGRKIKVAGERSYADWSITVMNDEDFSVRSMFEYWQNAINTIIGNQRLDVAAFEGYKTSVAVTQFAKDGTILRTVELVGAWPTQVSGIGLGWDSANAVEEFTVNWSYDYWIPVVEDSSIQTAGKVTPYLGEVELGKQV